MTYRLPSLHLGTSYDRPPAPAALPVLVAQDSPRERLILDGFSRGENRLWRLGGRAALIGLRVPETTSGLRVTLTLRADQEALTTWRDVVADPAAHPGHRLVDVRVQGRLRGALLLRQPVDTAKHLGQTIVVDLPPGTPPPGEPLLIELESRDRVTAGDEMVFARHGAAGLALVKLGVEVADAAMGVVTVSTGAWARDQGTLVRRDPGLVVVTVSGAAPPLTLTVRPKEDHRPAAAPSVAATLADGTQVPVSLQPEPRSGGFAAHLPRHEGPVFVRLVGDRGPWLVRGSCR